MSPCPPITSDDASHPRRRRRRSPDAATALLRALAPSVYVPTAVFALGSGAVQPVLVLAATDVGMSHAAAAGVLGLLGAVGVVSAPLTGVLVGRVGGQRSMVLGTAVAVAAVIAILLAMTVPGPLAVAGRRGPFVLQLLACFVALWGVLACALPDRQLRQVRRQTGQVAHQRQEATGERPPAVRSRVDHRATAVVAVAITCLQLLRTNRTVLVPLWGAHLGMSDSVISLTFAAGALVDVAMFIPSGRWMDRYGRLAGIVPALVIMGVALVVTIVWTSPTGFILGTCLMGFGNGFGSGIVMTMGADLAPSPGRERFLGWWQGIGNMGSAAGPFLVSALTSTAGLASGMWATAALGVVGGAWALVAVPRAYAHAGMDMRGRARH